jgi:hypothetical protein
MLIERWQSKPHSGSREMSMGGVANYTRQGASEMAQQARLIGRTTMEGQSKTVVQAA